MARIATSRIYKEPDGQYTTITTWRDDGVDGTTLITPAQNQTITAAINKARDDIASVMNGMTVREGTIGMRIE